MFEFFDRKVCLSLDGSPMARNAEAAKRKWQEAEKEFARVGLKGVEKFTALFDQLGSHQSFNRSTRQILIEFIESSNERLLFLEDDCVFKKCDHLQSAVNDLPEDWDIIYFGCNIKDEKPVKISNRLFKINGAWTTHCIGYNKKCIEFILMHQPGFSECMFDCWLSENLSRLNAYVVNPISAWQRSGDSSIWNEFVDYSDHFIQSQKKLDYASDI